MPTGEDVGHYGGSYKVTYDLHKKYGDFRLLDTPICGKSNHRPTSGNIQAIGAPIYILTLYTWAIHFCLYCNVSAENGFMGMGIGAAMTGLRPIIEGMNMGFLLLAYNQISNNAGMLHYTSGGQYKVMLSCCSSCQFVD